MGEANSRQAFDRWRDSAEKFDYFMAGLSAAILGYLAPTLESAKIGINAFTLELLAMAALLGSVLAAFKRIEATVHAQRIAATKLEKHESVKRLSTATREGVPVYDSDTGEPMERERITALLENRKAVLEIAEATESKIADSAGRWYLTRHWLLVCGFVLLIAAKIWNAY